MSAARPRRHGWTWARRATALAFLALLAVGVTPWSGVFRGTTAATTLLDVVPFVDPLAAVEAAAAARDVTGTMLIGAGILLGAAALVGPIFCGWVCPLGLLGDLNQSARSLARRVTGRAGPPSGPARPSATPRNAILVAFIVFAFVAGVPLFQAVSPINLLTRGLLLGSAAALAVVGAILVLEWWRPRLWCRVLCPLGALYGTVGRRGRLRVHVDASCERTPCRRCTRSCPMGIRVLEDFVMTGRRWVDDALCSRCGACADVCPRDVLHMDVRSPRQRERGATCRQEHRS